MNYKFVTTFTDYSHEHYNLIRNQLLRSNTPQDCWYLLSHILGHIDPTETFRSYLHLAYMMAGYQLRKFDPCLIEPLFKNLSSLKTTTKTSNSAELLR
jgi:hypothetical protein